MANNSITLHRVLKAIPAKVYRAFTGPDVMSCWLPPYGFLCAVHEMDVRGRRSHWKNWLNQKFLMPDYFPLIRLHAVEVS